jgi:catechol 2,3-dioxygenase-like lactoylglutathione lyase family enzyme
VSRRTDLQLPADKDAGTGVDPFRRFAQCCRSEIGRSRAGAALCKRPQLESPLKQVHFTGAAAMLQDAPKETDMVDMHLEVDIIPVSDVERSKQFYGRLGWRLDDDVAPAKDVRIVQFTPPGSGCSITFGTGLTPAAPGSAFGTLVVSDIVAAHADVVGRGIPASDIWHGAPVPPEARIPGPDPKRTSYGSFFAFNDPDGNAWIVQEVTTRRSGRT